MSEKTNSENPSSENPSSENSSSENSGSENSSRRIKHFSRRPALTHPHHEPVEGPRLGMAGNIANFFIIS